MTADTKKRIVAMREFALALNSVLANILAATDPKQGWGSRDDIDLVLDVRALVCAARDLPTAPRTVVFIGKEAETCRP